jgi:hypothetical protein
MGGALLSAIVVTPGSCRQVTALLRRLSAQTIKRQIEIVFVTTTVAELEPDEALLAGFARWIVIPVGNLESMASARAAGVRGASCPYIVFTEQHCFPEDQWAEAIVEAFDRHKADAVGPVFGNANPDLAASWANIFIEYGIWLEPHSGGLTNHLPGHNAAYRREPLLELGDALTPLIESEFTLHQVWHAHGRRLWVEPNARVHHVNITDRWAHLRAACAFQRPWASSRAREWGWPRRLAYALSWPLIALVRLPRTVGNIRRTDKGREMLPRILPATIVNLLASAFGEFLGYLGSLGDSQAVLLEAELYRERFLSSKDVRARALFE